MNRQGRDTTVCRNFCAYYKPGKNEDLACQGFIVVEHIVKKGSSLRREKSEPLSVPDPVVLQKLKDRVCIQCPFREQDCDFILSGGTAPACGGFTLLAHLLDAGELAIDEIPAGP
ncbi:MAG: hypothetical protein M0042_00115 [Nitrospiraceae bacterium]|nr:hypothetical protein [Nitrospiraceae bacterium]